MTLVNYYDRYWDKSQSNTGKHAAKPPGWPQEELEMFFNSIKHFVGRKVLDVGAGEGIFANFLKNRCAQIETIKALEISERAIKLGKKKSPWLEYLHSAVDTKLPYFNGEFDTVFMTDVIEHIMDVETAILEIRRILSKKGRIIIITPDFNFLKKIIIASFFWEKFFYPTNPHIRFFTRKSLKQFMEKFGFKEVFYKWGLTWHGIMPQNMYVVYEKS